MSIVFYRQDAAKIPVPPERPLEVEIALWQPARDGPPAGIFASRANQVWWLFDKLGLFARPDFTVVAVHRGGQLLHRLIVTPKWYRFRDMRPRDLQMGMLWTAPEARGQGLARIAIESAHRHFAGYFDRMWYLVEEDNVASRRLIESFSYDVAGRGERTARFGLRALGQFVITRPAGPD